MHIELLNANVLERWLLRESGTSGIATLKTFEQTIGVLIKGSSNESVRFEPVYNSNISWVASNKLDGTILRAIDETLNDDCIREIIKHISFKENILFGHFNVRFKALVEEKFKRLRIFPSTTGTIDLINFRYFLHLFGNSMVELSLSLHVFRSTFGHYFEHTKKNILQTISNYFGQELKIIRLYDFEFNERSDFEWFIIFFAERGIQVDTY